MTRTRHKLFTILSCLGLVLFTVLVPTFSPQFIRAQGPDKPSKQEFSRSQPAFVPASGAERRETIGRGQIAMTASGMRGQVNVIIELEAASAAEAAGPAIMRSSSAIQNQAARVEQTQASLMKQINAQGIGYKLLGRTRVASNAIAVRTDASNLPALNALPGVRAAYVERIGTFDNSTSVRFVSAPAAWSSGHTGNGITIGIIDSGINYLHANFGDPVTGAAYPSFPNPKVAGGYDFVGDTWNPNTNPVYAPDGDPFDQNGHGTHVAGTAAGYGMTTTGATFGGPWDASTPLSSLAIGPGVAPEATLYAYKVGSAASYVSEFATLQALDQAVIDGVDVINMSLGITYGNPDIGWARAANNAAQLGILIASSAGNAGDTYFIHSAPGAADWVLSVASSVDGNQGFDVTQAPDASVVGTYVAGPASFGPNVYDVTAPLEVVDDATGTVTDACQPLSGFTPGNVALIDRGGCTFTIKTANAQAAGAVGVLIITYAGDPVGTLGGSDPSITIPALMIAYDDGQMLKTQLASGNVTVNLDNAIVYGATADTLSAFSSRGPQRRVNGENVALKPDIAAPGDAITSSYIGSETASATLSGTSMAAPHVAGALALLREQHPAWSVPEIKALVMNTATNTLFAGENQTGDIYGTARVGVGRLNLANAVASEVIAYNAANPELVSVSFGIRDVTGPGSLSKNITVENKSTSTSYAFDLAYVPAADIASTAVSYTFVPSAVNLAPGQSTTVTVTLQYADPATWGTANTHDPTVAETQGGVPRHWLPEETGVIQFVANDNISPNAPDLWVPLYASLRPGGTMAATENTVTVSEPVGSTAIALDGTFVITADKVGLVTAFELLYESPDDPYPAITGQEREGYAPYSDMADIQYLGLTTDYYATGSVSATTIALGISTYGEWSSPAEEVWFETYFDVDGNGTADYVMYNWNYGAWNNDDSTDVFVTVVNDLAALGDGDPTNDTVFLDYLNYFSAQDFDTYLFRNNVLFFHVPAATLGLSDANPDFDFFTIGRQANASEVASNVDITDVINYNIAEQRLDLSGGFAGPAWWFDLPGETYNIPVSYDLEGLEEPLCVLLLHHHNAAPDQRTETVCYTVGPADGQDGDPATAEGADPGDATVLPSTGYPSARANSRIDGYLLAILAGSILALALTLGRLFRQHRERA